MSLPTPETPDSLPGTVQNTPVGSLGVLPLGESATSSDTLQVAHVYRDASGAPVEPEAQPTRRLITLPADIAWGSGPTDPDATRLKQKLPGIVTSELPAHAVARNLASQCAHCRQWNRTEFRKLKATWEKKNDELGLAMLDKIRAYLNLTENCTFSEMEEALGLIGVCEALTEIFHDVQLTFATGGCPEKGPDGQELASNFIIRDRSAQKQSSAAFDAVMRLAQG